MILSKIREIVSLQFNIDEEDIDGDTSFRDNLNADSLDLVELVMTLEDEFELEVEDDGVEDIKTVEDAVEYITNALENK